MIFVLAVILAVVLAYYLAEPLTRPPEPAEESHPSDAGEESADIARETLMQDLKDLELDYAGGKIPEQEYHARKEQILARIANLVHSKTS